MKDPAPIDKKGLRARFLAARRAIEPVQADAAADALARHMEAAIPEKKAIIAGYLPVQGEIDIVPALRRLARRGCVLCLPVAEVPGQPLVFRRWQPGDPLKKGMFGVEVPLATAPALVPDTVIVPLVAFDAAGHRLGYGAGYYDRTLEALRRHKPVRAIGAAFSLQQMASIPAETHDVRLDAVVTEQEIIEIA